MGLTNKLGQLSQSIQQDSSNNIGIGGAVNASYKLTVTGTTLTTGAATFSSSITAGGDITIPNGNYYYAKRNTGGASINVLGIASGSDTLTIKGGTSGATNSINFEDTGGTIASFYNGRLGLAMTNPGFQLSMKIKGSENALLAYYNAAGSATSYIGIPNGSGDVISTSTNADFCLRNETGNILFATNGNTERMRITSGGKLIIGTTSTTYGTLLGVQTSSSPAPVTHFYNSRNTSGDSCLYMQMGPNARDTSSYYLQCFDTIDNMYIYGNGNIVNRNNSYGTLSDSALKENIVDATPKLNDLLQLKVRNFNLIDDENKTKQIGFIAQEFEEIFPSMIDIDGKSGMKTIKTSVLIPMLVKAIQELSAKVTALENR